MPAKNTFLKQLLIWRYKNISDDNFLYIISIIVGLFAGLGAVIIKNLTFILSLLSDNKYISTYYREFYFITPVIGFLIVVFISKNILKSKVGHGIPMALGSLSKHDGRMNAKNIFSSMITAPITVSFGGSVGLEGPSVATGASIASNVAGVFRLKSKTRKLLLVCGAAASLSAIFKAPIAAILFAIEVFSLDLTLASLLPLLLASIAAVFTRLLFLGEQYILDFHSIENFNIKNILYFIAFGVFTGAISLYFTKSYIFIEENIKSIKNDYKKAAFAGICVGILVFVAHPLYGEGFEFMNNLILNNTEALKLDFIVFNFIENKWIFLGFILFLILLKPIATSLTLNGGGVGGIFAPTLFLGVVTGNFYTKFLNIFDIQLPESNFAMLGMAGLLAGILQAPLTAIFLIAEITGGYGLIIPLMLVVSVSFGISKKYVDHNIYTRQLKKNNQLVTHNKDQTVLMLLNLKPLIETQFIAVNPEMTFKEMLHTAVAKSNRNLFPVIENENKLVGIITLDDIREFMFDENSQKKLRVKYFMHQPPDFIDIDVDNVSTVIQKFQRTEAWNLPVVKEGAYIGFISKSKLLTAYRNKLIELTV
ncbi:MAG: chloride channel protein [Flavobacteriia bacterium]|nr:chloride channel protein [Flavobacteriia bacterium]OIP46978.1 MAG: chloride channel protein [Flavobacteriaceae bacterium CG2_30_31_66]PIV96608.1 MAG: chloride channel protein [Flavobacteriaceae bacterium CG17_big_fil_post_rev_8_21_14_2_50_31_13]PIX12272.1 MAG: chloride channel protein [Flavobacteriaceae bacterium CG_4_8_14_3_um_filter_31_8]PIY13894.1 MAG: chloride channel protein [Flavobacteriaceae bacterium CG_4_10_14_3_um_filter_31_253]PIZ10595.1 MAG: chloride channel protein [Flavobacter